MESKYNLAENNRQIISVRHKRGREGNVIQVLKDLGEEGIIDKLIEKNLAKLPGGKRFVLIKPNFVSVNRQLASTHKNAILPVLKLLHDYKIVDYIIIGEIAALNSTKKGFENFGYYDLQEEFGNWLHLIELDREEMIKTWVYDSRFRKINIEISKVMLNAPFRISVSPPKTHDTVIVTLGWKNMAVGCIKRCDKISIHNGFKAINFNIFKLGNLVYPHLVILDGYFAMEGNGPIYGNSVKLDFAIASDSVLGADSLTAKIMGFSLKNIGYLYYARKAGWIGLEKNKVIGDDWKNLIRKFKPHSTYKSQLNWRVEKSKEEHLLKEILDEKLFKGKKDYGLQKS